MPIAPPGSGGVPPGGNLGQTLLNALNELSRIKSLNLPDSLRNRQLLQQAEQAVAQARLAIQMATGSQQGMAAGAGGAGLGGAGQAGFITPSTIGSVAGGAALVGAGGLLLGGSNPRYTSEELAARGLGSAMQRPSVLPGTFTSSYLQSPSQSLSPLPSRATSSEATVAASEGRRLIATPPPNPTSPNLTDILNSRKPMTKYFKSRGVNPRVRAK